MIKVSYLSNHVGAEKFGTCACCGIGTDKEDKMIRIQFLLKNGENEHCSSICLCEECRGYLIESMKSFEEQDGTEK